jgi:drug/metabolite transporter (DMT)-like permease
VADVARAVRSAVAVRAPTAVEVMLLSTILLWALNLTVTRYILTHGFAPLAFTTIRYGIAAAAFVVITLALEGTLRIGSGGVLLVVLAGLTLYVNQIGFVYAVKTTSASLVALMLAAVPIFAALIGLVLGTERLSGRFWLGAGVSFVGVGLVVLGTGGEISGDLGGVLLGLLTAGTWAVYSVMITRLMRDYSPARISAVVLPVAWVPIALTGWPQTQAQDLHLGPEVWALFLFATFGPLVLTNFLWFHCLDRIGPARATLATNIQPFVAAVFAVVLLSESLAAIQVAGGVLIGTGILLARRRRDPPVPAE